ncbi:hypothetical protein Ae201684P_010254 [Aphanomyces euteiches]|uniref:Uncharacterized protein n=1 Tax=Aphanomyces euteiches TaxID=100861 RepID=A0A6G0WZS0_9STRA|nr:hypothetical protein Ae201684_009889 [Aphanomyces euteiches]KAH9096051.1 hypothetical protein Ae201684P_010254 [Aphanomyces euteiches]KAH9154745.1 hypothetical protein AeRB84_003206 [Aphanomyces euteiches]
MDSAPILRLRFELWKLMQIWSSSDLQQKQQKLITKPIYRAASFCAPSPPSEMPAVAAVVTTLLDHKEEPSPEEIRAPKKTPQKVTLDHLMAFKEKHEKIPFVLAWSVVYQHLILGSSSKSLAQLNKINTQEKLEEELTNAGVMKNDMVDIEGLIVQLNLRGDQPKKRRPSMI